MRYFAVLVQLIRGLLVVTSNFSAAIAITACDELAKGFGISASVTIAIMTVAVHVTLCTVIEVVNLTTDQLIHTSSFSYRLTAIALFPWNLSRDLAAFILQSQLLKAVHFSCTRLEEGILACVVETSVQKWTFMVILASRCKIYQTRKTLDGKLYQVK